MMTILIFIEGGMKKMIKLEDILIYSMSDVSIMDNMFPVITINHSFNALEYLSQELLNREVKKFDTYDGRIRVWLVEEEVNKND